ncbi:MAG: hypothetical protein JRF54_06310 [Deltaproteobacteria bacterium]|nr:hypothetical protein [Deltaproteobacteria bacterium]
MKEEEGSHQLQALGHLVGTDRSHASGSRKPRSQEQHCPDHETNLQRQNAANELIDLQRKGRKRSDRKDPKRMNSVGGNQPVEGPAETRDEILRYHDVVVRIVNRESEYRRSPEPNQGAPGGGDAQQCRTPPHSAGLYQMRRLQRAKGCARNFRADRRVSASRFGSGPLAQLSNDCVQ